MDNWQTMMKANAFRAKMKKFGISCIGLTAYSSKPIDAATVYFVDNAGKIWHVTRNYTELIAMRDGWCIKNQDWLCHLEQLPFKTYDGTSSCLEIRGLRFKAYLADDSDLAHVFDWLAVESRSGKDIGLSCCASECPYIPYFWRASDTPESILIESDLEQK